jgi:hypothetical protein
MQQDANYGMEVFTMTLVSDWERGLAAPAIDLEDWVFEKAELYIGAIVAGKAIQGLGSGL